MTPDPGLASWLQLTLTPGLGASTIRKLLRQFGLPQSVIARKHELAAYAGPEALEALHSDAVHAQVDRALRWAGERGHFIVTLADELYPRALLEIADPPSLIYARGRIELLQRNCLAIVGSRNATAQGESNAAAFAKALSNAGLTVVSGLAVGIDAAAHRGGLEGAGSTIAVLGTGIDVLYPKRNLALADRIAAQGLLLSEFPLGTGPAAGNFPRRNRLISGLALGCLVVEAAADSGSLITARLAAEQGREVFAIPGSIHSPLAKGCHALIKHGAKLVESARDILEELQLPAPATAAALPAAATDPVARRLLDALGDDSCDRDTLAARSRLQPPELAALLTQLEIEGHVAQLPGGLIQRVRR